MSSILATTKLVIKNQSAFLAQIASVYINFYRAAMEYIDNAADAASSLHQADPTYKAWIHIEISSRDKTVSFTDNCGGMEPSGLARLLGNVGDSTKKLQAWTNGQFGFGIQSFRGFARLARYDSLTPAGAASITLDANASDDTEVQVLSAPQTILDVPGTRVTISQFKPGVFGKTFISKGLIAEISRHFDDVIRTGILEISIRTDDELFQIVRAFDFEALPGEILKSQHVLSDGCKIDCDLRVLDKTIEDRPPMLASKGRRIQGLAELRSYKAFAKAAGRNVSVWQNPFVAGIIEINGAINPVLTRDDLLAGEKRDELYSFILQEQLKLEELISAKLEKKKEDAFSKVAAKMSECLASVLKRYHIKFDQSSGPSNGTGSGVVPGVGQPFGGDDVGGGGPAGDGEGDGGDEPGENGEGGPGAEPSGGGDKGPGEAATSGSGAGANSSSAPQISFRPLPKEQMRVIPFGSMLTVNTAHGDFSVRQPKGLRVTQRMVSYVASVIAGPCVEFLYAKRGRPLVAAFVAEQVVDISIALEAAFNDSGILDDIYALTNASE